MSQREELIDQLRQYSDELDRTLRRSMRIDWPDVELTMPQLKTLVSLVEGPLRMGDIASQSGISHSAATAMIDRLVDKELVTRTHDEHDRRVVVCELSENGRRIVERIWRVREESLRKLSHHMTDDELQTVIASLRIMIQAAARNSSDTAG